MFRLLKLFIILAALTGLGLWGGNAFAATKTSVAAGGNWNTAATWSPSGVPATGDTVIIAGPGAVAVNTTVTQTAAGSVTVNPGATLNATSNTITFGALTVASGGTFTVSRILTVLGNTDVSGTINLSGGRANIFTGNVTLNNGSVWNNTTTSTQTFSGDFTNNAATFTASGSGGYTFNGAGHTLSGATVTAHPTVIFTNNYINSGTLSVSGTLTVTGTSIRLTNNGTITATASLAGTGGVTQGTSATLNLGGTTTITTLIANAVGNTVNYTGAGQTVDTPASATYYNLTLSGSGTKAMPALAVTGNFTISSGVTVNATAALTVGGNWIETGTFTPNSQTVTLNGLSTQTISGTSPVAFYNLTVTSPNITLSTNVTVANTLAGTVTLTSTCPTDYTLTSTVSPPNQTLHSCPATAPTVTTNAASAVSITGATLNGTVSSNRADTAVTFEYGLTAPGYGSGPIAATPSPVLGSNSSPTAVSAVVTGLTCNTLYHFRVIGVNSVGTTNGLDGTFTTSACTAPTVTTLAANALSMSGATLNGTVSSNGADTTVTFEYGTNVSYLSGPITATPNSVLGSNSSSTSVFAPVTGLICNTLYHFRAKGVNSVGSATGGDQSFTTSACPSLGNVINTYYPGTASVAAGATSITLGAATGVGPPIASGDTLLIMQMQDASMDTSNTSSYGAVSAANAGRYEYVIAASFVGDTLTLACGTANAYSNAAATGTAGKKTYQVIRVPVYSNVTLTSTLTARAWDGSTGGVLAFDATGVLTLGNATVSVNGMGFRGGASRLLNGGAGANTDYRTMAAVNNNASKGEGIAGTPYYVFTAPSTLTNTGVEGYPNGSHGRGAPANGGGGATDLDPVANDQNPGGGGGANGGAGGMGGIGWCPTFANTPPYYVCGLSGQASATNLTGSTGGFGGTAVAGLGATRLTLGGGGGGGTTNDGTGALAGGLSSSGAAGGGIIMLRASSMSGTATFNANGSNGDSTVANDGTGGGGAGGAVLISAGSGMVGATINVKGGNGGTNLGPSEVPSGTSSTPHGPGGGGGGGYAMTSGGTAACNSAGGANGVTYNGGVLFGAYGSTSGSAGSCVTSLAASQIPGTQLGATSCLHHYELYVPASSITCLPTTVTVTACTDGSNPCTSVATGVSGTANLATSGGTIITPATVTAGWATTTLSDPGAPDGTKVTVTLTSASPLAANAATCRSGGDCSVVSGASTTFHTAGFIFSTTGADGAPEATVPNQVAGVSFGPYWLRSVITNSTTKTCQAAFTSPHPVTFNYQCADPALCSGSNWLTIGSTTFGSGGTTINLSFDGNGNASLGNFNFGDVGRIGISASATSAASTTTVAGAPLFGTMKGTSGSNFVVKPHHFDLSPIQQTAGTNLGNPAAADARGGKFVKAGEQFSITVTAKNAANVATPNYGKESTTEGVKLTEALVLPNLGQIDNPALGGGFGLFTNGVATGTAFTWNEVGIITLTPSILSANYLGVAGDTIGTQSTVGRFYAAKFALSGGSIANRTDIAGCTAGCGPFTYMGEQMSAVFTLTAKAVDGTTTLQNYNWSATAANQFAKLNPMAAVTSETGAPLGMGAVDTAAPRTAFTPCGVTPAHPCLTPAQATTGTFASGEATVTVPFTIYRDNAAAAGPYALLDVGVNPADSDGTALATLDLAVNGGGFPNTHGKVGSTQTRYGRLKMQNIYGSEKLPLAIPLQAQYWNGSYFINNADDSSTGLSVPGSGTAPPTGVPNLYFYPVTGKNQLGNSNTTASLGTASLVAGVDTLAFSAPGALHPGWLDIILQVPTYLRGQWGNCMGQTGTVGLYDDYPCARATFGVYGAKSPIIYRRENY